MSSRTIEDEITEWANRRPVWQRSVLRRRAAGEAFGTSEIADLVAELLDPEGFGDVKPLNAKEIPGPASAGGTVCLGAVRDLVNVNALLGGQTLTFGGTGMTLIYGDNGSGKSGYARLLKELVGSRHPEPIGINAFDPHAASTAQAAQVEFTVAGSPMSASWPGPSPVELRAVNFYDERCGDVYLTKDSVLDYRPSALKLLDGLIEVCDALRGALDDALTANQLIRNAKLPTIDPATEAGGFVEKLSASTTTAQLDEITALPDGSDTEIARLLAEQGRLKGSDPEKEKTRLAKLSAAAKAVDRHLATLSAELQGDQVTRVAALRRNAETLRAAAGVASKASFDGEPLPAVGGGAWRAMFEAARTYSVEQAYPDHGFPHTDADAKCVLCQQDLSEDASGRLDRFQAFIADTTARDAAAAEAERDKRLKHLKDLVILPAAIAQSIESMRLEKPELASAVEAWLKDAEALRDAMIASLLPSPMPPLEVAPSAVLTTWAGELDQAVASLDPASFREMLRSTTSSLAELQARNTARENRPLLEAEVTRLKERAGLERLRSGCDTAAITRQSTKLEGQFVTNAVREQFQLEASALRIDRIELKKTGGEKGRTKHRPQLLGTNGNQKVIEVLSEGEQTALSLAGYFTEAHFDATKSALVLDDPVSSLDHVRRRRVAQRLSALAQQRQIVVFSHDMSFVDDLVKEAKVAGVTVHTVGIQRRGNRTPGLITDQHPWRVKDVKSRLSQLEVDVIKLKKERSDLTEDDYTVRCEALAGRLSQTWERIVNLEVVSQVFEPAAGEVRPRMFRVLAKITDQDDSEFQTSYTRISGWAPRHDQAPDRNFVPPEPDELEKELQLIVAWHQRIVKYRS